MSALHRRDFLKDSALFAAALAGVSNMTDPLAAAEEAKAAKKGQANDRLNVAVLGVNGRGMDHVGGFANKHNCQITTICDPDEAVIGKAMKAVEKAQGKAPKYERDLRRVMEDKSIDIISIATPNHWHSLAAIWALQAGKDVYVEKPVSHNVHEGRIVVETARKHNRICQTGTQCRSMKGMREAIEYVHSGKLGKVKLARGLCYKLRPSIGLVTEPQPIPKSIDYNLWCGPAPESPLMRRRLHYDWHWVWETGNGDLGNQGIHQMDIARWGLGKDGLAEAAYSFGGRFGYKDNGETANTQVCVFDYGESQLIFEVRGLPTPKLMGAGVGVIFYGSEGNLVIPSYDSGVVYTKDGAEVTKFKGGGDHYGNFVQAVRDRKSSDLHADIQEGHLSSALCHLGNISYRLGKEASFASSSEAFSSDANTKETFQRMQEHLEANKIALDKTPIRMGRQLKLDPRAEMILGDKEASAMLTREYRKGFEVPAKV